MTDRIRALLNWRNLTPTQFADLIQVGRPIISHILSGRNKASLEVVQRIVAAFPEVALPWLLTGTGPMLANDTTTPSPVPAAPASSAEASVQIVTPATAEKASRTTQPAVKEPVSSSSRASKQTPIAAENEPAAPQATPWLPQRDEQPLRQPQNRFKAGAGSQQAAKAAPAVAPGVMGLPTAQPAAVSSIPPEPIRKEVPLPSTPVTSAVSALAPGEAASAELSGPVPAPAPGLGISIADKPIRRIVIFYQDGSFTDFQPEK